MVMALIWIVFNPFRLGRADSAPTYLWTFITFFKISDHLYFIWEQSGIVSSRPSSLTLPWQPLFERPFFRTLTFLKFVPSFRSFSCFFIVFGYFSVNFNAFQRFWKIKKSKMAVPKWPPFKNMAQFLCHITSSAYFVDLKGKSVGRAICL